MTLCGKHNNEDFVAKLVAEKPTCKKYKALLAKTSTIQEEVAT